MMMKRKKSILMAALMMGVASLMSCTAIGQEKKNFTITGKASDFARFRVSSAPYYFLVSPEGKLIANKFGYGKGSLFKFVKETIARHNKEKTTKPNQS